ncbi:hypothetical protein HJD18_05065 [Thermoleophilia bacterium SCSIO 60948]|nr:hypothetical protein HJD18_05065 [Thermoleophilia bacterium SCSIO 60948]
MLTTTITTDDLRSGPESSRAGFVCERRSPSSDAPAEAATYDRPMSLFRPLRVAATALCLLAAGLALAPAAGAAKPKRPFVYVVVLDGLDGDAVTAERAPFISSLIDGQSGGAAYFPRSSSVIPAETNPNHTAMMSGAYPGRSGIAANAFAIYAPLANADSCRPTGQIDLTAIPSETSGENRNCPQAEFTFEAIHRQGDPKRIVSAGIFGKPKLGRIFAGRNFRSRRTDADYLWAPCDDGADDDAYCQQVATNPVTGYAADDSIVMDEVVRTVTEGVRRGVRTRRPNFTFVNLPQIDSAGHATGRSPAYDSAVTLADAQIERLVGTLRGERIWKRSVLMLVSDHSMDSTPQKVSLGDAFEAEGIDPEDFLAVQNGSLDSIYLADRRSKSRFALLRKMRSAALDVDGVDEVLYRRPNPSDGGRRHTVGRVHPGWHTGGARSGDLIATTDASVAFSESAGGLPFPLPDPTGNPLPGNHGNPVTADNFLALAGGSPLVRDGIVRGKRLSSRPVNVDIAPTVMRLLGLRPPADSRGRFLSRAIRAKRLR